MNMDISFASIEAEFGMKNGSAMRDLISRYENFYYGLKSVGAGVETAAILVDKLDAEKLPTAGIKNPVILVTKDPLKKEILENVYDDKIPVIEFSPEDLLEREKQKMADLEETTWEKLEEIGFSEADADEFLSALAGFEKFCEKDGDPVFFLLTEKGEEVVSDFATVAKIKSALLESKKGETAAAYYLDVFNDLEKVFKEKDEIVEAVIRDLPRQAEMICCCAQNRDLDLHPGQFLKVNNKVYCIDAFV